MQRFDGGYYDSTTDEVYIDQGARVARISGGRLVDEPVKAPAAASAPASAAGAPAICSDTTNYTHCETVVCQDATFWLNYVNDNFSYAPFGTSTLKNGNYINVRNTEGKGYRLVPSRGVRMYKYDHWGYITAPCSSNGYSN